MPLTPRRARCLPDFDGGKAFPRSMAVCASAISAGANRNHASTQPASASSVSTIRRLRSRDSLIDYRGWDACDNIGFRWLADIDAVSPAAPRNSTLKAGLRVCRARVPPSAMKRPRRPRGGWLISACRRSRRPQPALALEARHAQALQGRKEYRHAHELAANGTRGFSETGQDVPAPLVQQDGHVQRSGQDRSPDLRNRHSSDCCQSRLHA